MARLWTDSVLDRSGVGRPARTYDEACTRFYALLRQDSEAVDPPSRARLLTPGHRTDRAIVFHIRDPGNGFNREAVSHAAKANDPDSVMHAMENREAAGLRSGGFGMLIVRQVVDEMVYNERGNEVLLIKHLKKE